MLPGSQCAKGCYDCDTALASKCYACDDGYKLTKNGTCAPVRLLQAWPVGACTCMMPCRCALAALSLTTPCVCSLDRSVRLAATGATWQGPASAMTVLKITF